MEQSPTAKQQNRHNKKQKRIEIRAERRDCDDSEGRDGEDKEMMIREMVRDEVIGSRRTIGGAETLKTTPISRGFLSE